jgi:hypothetical protein
MYNHFPFTSHFLQQPLHLQYTQWIGHVGVDWGSMGFAGYHPTLRFGLAVLTNSDELCWDSFGQQYTEHCGLHELLCNAWNVIFEELGQGQLPQQLNCTTYDYVQPLHLP